MKYLIFSTFVVITFVTNFVSIVSPIPVPEKIDETKIEFYLWNKNTVEQEVSVDNYGNITKAPVKILIHGYVDGGNGEDFFFYAPLVQKYIKTGVNVICVDWSFYSRRLYQNSVILLKPVAVVVGKFIENLCKQKGIRFQDIHIIGHSLGAHIGGFIGKYIQEKNNREKLGRVTGIDPAGPLFKLKPPTLRLHETDATLVDTIIADIYLFGMDQTLGQVNFYVWCGGKPELLFYNHALAPFYYSYGISKFDLIAKQCQCVMAKTVQCKDNPTNILGQNVNFNNTGTYYINLDAAAVMKDAIKATRSTPKSIFKLNLDAIQKGIFQALSKAI